MSVQTDSDAENTQEDAADSEDAPPDQISKDDAFHILQNARRRAVLRFLAEHPEQDRFVMRDIAEEVAAWEHGTTVQQLVSAERQRVYIALYQSHLPKLDKHNLIDYNQSRGVVEKTELTPVLDPYLEDGLHSDSDLSVEDVERPRGDEGRSSLTTAVSTLFSSR